MGQREGRAVVPGPIGVGGRSPWWLFGVIVAAALLKPGLALAAVVAATVGAFHAAATACRPWQDHKS